MTRWLVGIVVLALAATARADHVALMLTDDSGDDLSSTVAERRSELERCLVKAGARSDAKLELSVVGGRAKIRPVAGAAAVVRCAQAVFGGVAVEADMRPLTLALTWQKMELEVYLLDHTGSALAADVQAAADRQRATLEACTSGDWSLRTLAVEVKPDGSSAARFEGSTRPWCPAGKRLVFPPRAGTVRLLLHWNRDVAPDAEYADVLTGEGPDVGGMSKREPGADLGAQIRTSSSGSGAASGSGDTVRMSGKVRSSDAAKPPLSLVLTGVRVAPATTLTAVMVQNKVASAYFAGVKRCYRSVLAGNPAQPRKLEMSFTVSVNGRVIRPNVTGPAQDFVACVASLVASWRFPIPKDHDGEPLEVQASMTIDAHD